jgi:hypothetical protein
MCAVSQVGDQYRQQFQGVPEQWQGYQHQQQQAQDGLAGSWPSRAEFDDLRRQVLEMKEQLIKAKAEDVKNGEPDCVMEVKVRVLKEIAQIVGVSLEDVFKP